MKPQIIVIGAGAAGLMAAGQAASQGADVRIYEKMKRPARKLRITGKGRCNLTNTAPLPEFIRHFGHNGKFLRQAFGRFFAPDLVAFFQELGVETTVERGERVFPTSNQAQQIVDTLVNWAQGSGAELFVNQAIDQIVVQDQQVSGIRLRKSKHIQHADAVILATGGASYPATGSSGDGYRMAEKLGHTIISIRPALIPLETGNTVASELQGLALKSAEITLEIDGRKIAQAKGELLFTHFGLSGPIILTLSGQVVDALNRQQTVFVSIDLKPAFDPKDLDKLLLSKLNEYGKQQISTILKQVLPTRLASTCIDLSQVSRQRKGHQISAKERKALGRCIKALRLPITDYRPLEEAIVTAGGVDTREIQPKTMASRLIDGLYFAGEVIDIDADTGGYNLQAAFSTGWVAGQAAARKYLMES